MKPARSGPWAFGAALACGACLLAYLLLGDGRREERALPMAGSGMPVIPADAELIQGASMEDKAERLVSKGAIIPAREAQQSVPVTTDEVESERGLTLRMQAMWGALAPIPFQGFKVSVRAFPDPHAQPKAADDQEALSGIDGQPDKRDKILEGGLAVGTTDESGQVIFEDLPPGMLTIVALGNGLSRSALKRSFVFSEDASNDFVAPAGLAYGGSFDAPVEAGLQIRLHSAGVEPSRLVLDADGSFLFWGLQPGKFYVDLYDPERWAVLERYPSFALEQNRFGVRLALPRWGDLSLRTWNLPEGVSVMSSYIKRIGNFSSEQGRDAWILGAGGRGEPIQFTDLPYGNYMLYLRGESMAASDTQTSYRTLARIPVRLDRPQLNLDWTYAVAPKVWLRISLRDAIENSADSNSFPRSVAPVELYQSRGITFTQVDLDLIRQGRGNEISLKGPAILVRRGALYISSVTDGIEQRQGFTFLSGELQAANHTGFQKSPKPFLELAPIVKDGSIELMLLSVPGRLTLRVELDGFHATELTFVPSNGLVLEIAMLAREPMNLPLEGADDGGEEGSEGEF